MGEIHPIRLARGKRVVEVKAVDHRRDPQTKVSLTIGLGSAGTATALLTNDERRQLIEALGGTVND